MPPQGPSWSITYFDEERFVRSVKELPQDAQVVIKIAMKYILTPQGFSLARTPWLKSLGGGLWEFRIGPSAKAVVSKAGDPRARLVQNSKILIRVYCTFTNEQIAVFGIFDKQRHGSGSKQSKSIALARKQLLTFKTEK
jgi:hypothetical protein